MYRSITRNGEKAVLISESCERDSSMGILLFATKMSFGVMVTRYTWFYYKSLGQLDLKVSEVSMANWEFAAIKTHMDNEECPLCEEYVKQLVKVNDHRIEHDELCEACYEKEDALAMAHEELERTSDWGRAYREVV